ncbi:hypothetical protein [Erysipelothrix rhusiopathiae]|uniref:DUF4145 domain-containing protein n=1 Tax=Erysipelothrix rhusiopathiae ATCC 19414 TaxID=525280 RepID=E7FVR7_ERYRH|nr:hypothetical protein [Erysipelothrix rhusiopathiae]EFY08987.1 hypothetical protein HMPREF0357_11094 [Erysipelothrix rhusiopathiae ATCC 19414]VEH83478.1 Uncharacterised protein [Erysipelothrix rhusiopathiae]
MSYVDFRKSSNHKKENEAEIEEDKKLLMNNLMTNTSIQKEEIINRLYEVADIGSLNIEKHLALILDEAELLYAYGFYLGCISIVGLVSEEFCKKLIKINNISRENVNNEKTRITRLKTSKVITVDVAGKLDFIRIARNNCIHYSDKFKQMNEVDIKQTALKNLNSFKEIIRNFYEQADPLFSYVTLK